MTGFQISRIFGSSDIHMVTEFCRKPTEHITRLRESKHPEILTVDGKAAVVVQDAESYAKLTELADYANSFFHIRQALAEEGRSLKELCSRF